MPRMLPNDTIWFPKLTSFVKNDLPERVFAKQKVWKAFLKYTALPWLEAIKYVKCLEDSPVLRISPLPSDVNGRFYYSTPKTIHLSSQIARRFEREYHLPRAQICVESTILHELVHVADYLDGQLKQPEQGVEFEYEAYDENIDRWWVQGDRSIKNGEKCTIRHDTRFENDISKPKRRAFRNNNPGNIKKSDAVLVGLASLVDKSNEINQEVIYCVFKDEISGITAMLHQLSSNIQNGFDTLQKILSRRANECSINSTQNYIKFVSKRLPELCSVDADLSAKQNLINLAQSIMLFENGSVPYKEELFYTAYLRLNTLRG